MKHNRREMLKTAGLAAIAATAITTSAKSQSASKFDNIPRIRLTNLPTACNKMENVTKAVGAKWYGSA